MIMGEMDMELAIKSLTKKYGNIMAVDNISLTISQGMFGLLGPNGAGKSTLMQIITTLLKPTAGQVLFNNLDIQENKPTLRKQLGYLPQEFGLYKKLNAWEFTDFICHLKGINSKKARHIEIERVLRQVNLWVNRKQRIHGYSGGMKRRLGIAQALIGNPKLLIVDEPTAGLDPEERIRFRNLLTQLSGERIVILSTHIVSDIESCCNQLAVLKQGKLIFTGDQQGLTKKAEGKVWKTRVNEQDLNTMNANAKIVSTKREQGYLVIRYLDHRLLGQESIQVKPTLEDGYMALTQAAAMEDSHETAVL